MDVIHYLDAGGVALAYRHREGRGPTLVFLPGYRSDMAGTKASALDRWAESEGRAMLRFDYSGCGSSGGEFEAQTLEGWRDNALALIDRVTEGPLVLVGSSMGGWLMLLVALARPERVAGLVGIAAAPDFTAWGFTGEQKLTILREGKLVEPNPYDDEPQVTTRVFWESAEGLRLMHAEIAIDCPVRLLHGESDSEVPWTWSLELMRRLRSADVQVDAGQGGRPPPVARFRHRAAARDPGLADGATVILPLLALAALQSVTSIQPSAPPAPPPAPAPSRPPARPAEPAAPAADPRAQACAAQARSDPAAAIEAANAWRARGGGLEARECLGLAYVQLGQWDAAGTAYEEAARAADAAQDPRRADVWTQAGNAWIAAGDYPRAVRALDAALLVSGLADPIRGELDLDRARARVAMGDPAGAREDIDRALRLVPDDPMAWYLSAALARRADDLTRARTDIAEAMRRAPDSADIALLAGTLAGLAGDEAEAERLYRRVAQEAPDSDAGRAAAASFATLHEVEVPAPAAPESPRPGAAPTPETSPPAPAPPPQFR